MIIQHIHWLFFERSIEILRDAGDWVEYVTGSESARLGVMAPLFILCIAASVVGLILIIALAPIYAAYSLAALGWAAIRYAIRSTFRKGDAA